MAITLNATREEMIDELTRFELDYLIGDSHVLEEAVSFFSKGGFNTYTDQELKRQYEIIFND